MATINLCFPILGTTVQADRGYSLFSALAHLLPALHGPDAPLAIGPIAADYVGQQQRQLDPRRSLLRLRLPAESIPLVLPLAGKSLVLSGHKVRLGVPQVRSLVPAPALIARLVTIKKSDRHDKANSRSCMEPAAFLAAAGRQLETLGIEGEAAIPLVRHTAAPLCSMTSEGFSAFAQKFLT
jgi:CRISPR-associated protein Cas6